MGYVPRSPDHRPSRFELVLFIGWLVVVAAISVWFIAMLAILASRS